MAASAEAATPSVADEPDGAAPEPDTATAPTTPADEGAGEDAGEVLSAIKGVGPAKQELLLSVFGSLEGLRDASVDELEEVKGVGRTLAERLHAELAS